MSQQIIKDQNIEALKVAASWPGADRATLVTLATVLAATGADHDGLSYFEALAASQPDQVLPLALAGYFQCPRWRGHPGWRGQAGRRRQQGSRTGAVLSRPRARAATG